MPLTPADRRFLKAADHFKIYLLLLGVVVLVFLVCAPTQEVQMGVAVMGVALCSMFWLTQRLLTVITILDLELTKAIEALKRALPAELHRDAPRR